MMAKEASLTLFLRTVMAEDDTRGEGEEGTGLLGLRNSGWRIRKARCLVLLVDKAAALVRAWLVRNISCSLSMKNRVCNAAFYRSSRRNSTSEKGSRAPEFDAP